MSEWLARKAFERFTVTLYKGIMDYPVEHGEGEQNVRAYSGYQIEIKPKDEGLTEPEKNALQIKLEDFSEQLFMQLRYADTPLVTDGVEWDDDRYAFLITYDFDSIRAGKEPTDYEWPPLHITMKSAFDDALRATFKAMTARGDAPRTR